MRLLLRLIGTWLIGMALILLIIDGTRSLAASAIVATPLEETWALLHAQSLTGLRQFVATRFFGPFLESIVAAILAMPGWVVLGVPGAFIAWLGRTRRSRLFVKEDQL